MVVSVIYDSPFFRKSFATLLAVSLMRVKVLDFQNIIFSWNCARYIVDITGPE